MPLDAAGCRWMPLNVAVTTVAQAHEQTDDIVCDMNTRPCSCDGAIGFELR
jgi:hypothetical protein